MNASPLFAPPLIGIGFRVPTARWTLMNLRRFDVLEVTVDHYVKGGEYAHKAIANLVDRIPLVLHGVGLSLGTDAPLDDRYVDEVAQAIDELKVPSYSEHLAWTKVPGLDLANLLPVPRTRAVADVLIRKIERLQSRLPVPFSLENISYVFDFPDGEMSDAEFFNLLFRETGVGMLLDVENLFVNSENQALVRQRPQTVILERDNDIERGDELLADVERIRGQVARSMSPREREATDVR